jgi:2-hydroxychromene-2-carboxylate isomerase
VQLIVYGDFNSSLSYLASSRVDVILDRQLAAVEWRAIEHDPGIPVGGLRVDSSLRAALNADIAEIRRHFRRDESLPLCVPAFVSNTAAATAAYAAASAETADAVRREIFRAVWSEGRNVSARAVVELVAQTAVGDLGDRGERWRASWSGLEAATVPMLVLHTGYVARGSVAVACLARLAFTGSLPYRPWADFRSDVLDEWRADRRGLWRRAGSANGEVSRRCAAERNRELES